MRIPIGGLAYTLVVVAAIQVGIGAGSQAGSQAAAASPVHFAGKTKYLNNAHAVVSHSIDDSTKYVSNCIDAMDKYGIKATIFVSTEQDPAPADRFFT
jgi:hypothetical protein